MADKRKRAPRAPRKEKEDTSRLRKSRLGPMLGISLVTLDRYLAMEGAPVADRHMTFVVEEVAAFIAKQKTEEGKVRGLSFYNAELARLKCEQLVEEIARERGDYISKKEAGKTIVPLMKELGDLLRQKFVSELPARYLGRDTIECVQMNEDACDLISRRFRDGASTFLS